MTIHNLRPTSVTQKYLNSWKQCHLFKSKNCDYVFRQKGRNGLGRRLVELTEGCHSGGDSHGLPGWIKQPPCPWGTLNQFSIKALLSKEAVGSSWSWEIGCCTTNSCCVSRFKTLCRWTYPKSMHWWCNERSHWLMIMMMIPQLALLHFFLKWY